MARRRKRKKQKEILIPKEVQSSIFGLLMIAIAILIIISFFEKGKFLIFINHFLIGNFGFATIILPFSFICLGLFLLKVQAVWSRFSAFLGSLFLFLSVLFLFKQGELGLNFFNNIAELISVFGAYVVFIIFFLIANLVTFNISLEKIFFFLKTYQVKRAMHKKKKESDDALVFKKNSETKNSFVSKLNFDFGKTQSKFNFDEENAKPKQNEDKSVKINKKVIQEEKKLDDGLSKINILKTNSVSTSLTKIDNTLKPMTISQAEKTWKYPPLSIFENAPGGEANRGDIKQNATIIEKTLDSFGVRAKVVEVNKGPSVTQYGLEISMGTKLSKIKNLADNLALALAAPTGQIRIEAPIAGRSLVGIEVPNQKAAYVTLREMLKNENFKNHKSKLAVALGIDVGGNPIVGDLAKFPHVLIAGATGSGKSVGLDAFLCSILFRASPDEVKFILVDPKRVGLTLYNNIPHLYCPVIVNDIPKVVSALKWAVNEMDNRYKKLEEAGVKIIDSYNALAQETAIPKIVIVLDEFGDIMLFAPSEVEESITRLAQMGRAVGIHLVLATQRPSVNVITGLIKANIPTRISFNVSSMMDSRVILDTAGAEKLLGNGDMLYIPPDSSKPTRIQGTFVNDKDINSLIAFLKNEAYPVNYEAEITSKFKVGKGGKIASNSNNDKDERYGEAVQLLAQYDKASSSFLQRRLSIGYSRAARILDQLFSNGLVGPANGSKPREINRTKLMEYLSQIDNE
jgi:S-DNA-T family DNA segregation ATPase FtsK/SpoIIIE